MRWRKATGRATDKNQLHIDWTAPAAPQHMPVAPSAGMPVDKSPAPLPTEPIVQQLPWDFQSTFPEPTSEALEAGTISGEETDPESIKFIHDEHGRELLIVLHDLDALHDARRHGVDPISGKPPRTPAACDRLQKLFELDIPRLERTWQGLMGSYQDAFGIDAAEAFDKAIRARHAGVEVVAEPRAPMPQDKAPATDEAPPPSPATRQHHARRTVARLPVPKPLPEAIASGNFGHEENGRPVRPGPAEVRAITEQHADKLIELLRSRKMTRAETEAAVLSDSFSSGINAYAADFGQDAARQLEAYVCRQASLDGSTRTRRR